MEEWHYKTGYGIVKFEEFQPKQHEFLAQKSHKNALLAAAKTKKNV